MKKYNRQQLYELILNCEEGYDLIDHILELQENSIPKKKIEDVKNEYEERYKKHKAVADKQFEEVGTRDCFDNELAIRDLGAIRACEKLLKDK